MDILKEALADKGQFVNIRGFPRLREDVMTAQSMIGGILLSDTEADLMATLDVLLAQYRIKQGEYPDALKLPNDPDLYVPVPFQVQFQGIQGLEMESLHKPAWFRVKKQWKI